jgi:hypothetical protein
MRDDLFEDVAHHEIVAIALVVIDVAPSEGRLIEMPDKNLFFARQLLEAISIKLHHRRVVYLLETVRAIGLLRRWRGRCRHLVWSCKFPSCRSQFKDLADGGATVSISAPVCASTEPPFKKFELETGNSELTSIEPRR